MPYEQSELWKRYLAPQQLDENEPARTRLRSAYTSFWDRGIRLSQQISSDFSSLTLHDEAHLSALWEIASQLACTTLPLNPLEVFILGGAILLHDAGHALASYPGGLNEIKNTMQYKDFLAAAVRRRTLSPKKDSKDQDLTQLEEEVLFRTIRKLHISQASVLGTQPIAGVFLLDDTQLRSDLGEVIGRIAVSHGLDRDDLDNLPRASGGLAGMPLSWTINPKKLAILLRCADALQIDERRVPLFAYALHNPKGISRLHWLAQQLNRPYFLPGELPKAISFSSKTDFTEAKSDAWWLAYDLINIADNELSECYNLLKDMNLGGNIVADRVAGANRPYQLQGYIRVSGWLPVNTELRVSSVHRMVELFGGALLYGRDPCVPLRELIQNAGDSIRARKELQNLKGFRGKINVALKSQGDGTWRLCVEDNGLGMSKEIMTGTLLEFGKSFWSSDDMSTEFPGLSSAGLQQSGKYGIGFFSVFILAKAVEVISKRYDFADDEIHKLKFHEGFGARPILKKAEKSELGLMSTRVELIISEADVERLLRVSNHLSQEYFKVSLDDVVAHLCPSLDFDVYTIEGEQEETLSHSNNWATDPVQPWLNKAIFLSYHGEDALKTYIQRAESLLRPLKDGGGHVIGRASIAFGSGFYTGLVSVDRLISANLNSSVSSFSQSYIGVLAFESDGPRRSSLALVDAIEVVRWASDQAELIDEVDFSKPDRLVAAMNVASFGGDPTPIATILLERQFCSILDVKDRLDSGVACLLPLDARKSTNHRLGQIQHQIHPSGFLSFGFADIDVRKNVIESWEPWHMDSPEYYTLASAENEAGSSFFTCLDRLFRKEGKYLAYSEVKKLAVATYKGEQSGKEKLMPGMELIMDCLELSVKRLPS